jgi:hypothetical protein
MRALQLSRDLDVQYKTAFVLAHKIREALADEKKEETVSGEVEIDGAYFVKPANWTENRRDRRLLKNQSGKRRVVVIMRSQMGLTIPRPQQMRDIPPATLAGWRKIAVTSDRLSSKTPDQSLRSDADPNAGPYDKIFASLVAYTPEASAQQAWADAIRDAAMFLAVWSTAAFRKGWSIDDIFGPPTNSGAGLIWLLKGRRVQSVGADFARMGNGALFCRNTRSEMYHPDAVGYTL